MDFFFRPDPIAWVQSALGPDRAGVFGPIGELGMSWGLLLASSLALWLFGRRALYALLSLAAAEGLARGVIAGSLDVPRPESPALALYEPMPESGSFPSGHASTAAAVWIWLGLATRFPLALAVLLSLAVGLSRLYMGVHYLEDVVGGLVLGAGLAVAWLGVAPRLRRWTAGWSFGAWLAVAGGVLVGAVGAAVLRSGGGAYLWDSVGFVAGGAVAIPLEWRRVGYRPAAQPGLRLRASLVGAAVLVPLFTLHLLDVPPSPQAGGALLFLATLWALLVAPWLFVRRGWARGPGATSSAPPPAPPAGR